MNLFSLESKYFISYHSSWSKDYLFICYYFELCSTCMNDQYYLYSGSFLDCIIADLFIVELIHSWFLQVVKLKYLWMWSYYWQTAPRRWACPIPPPPATDSKLSSQWQEVFSCFAQLWGASEQAWWSGPMGLRSVGWGSARFWGRVDLSLGLLLVLTGRLLAPRDGLAEPSNMQFLTRWTGWSQSRLLRPLVWMRKWIASIIKNHSVSNQKKKLSC